MLVFWEVNADAASTASWRRVDVVAGQMHVGLILALCGSLAILLTTPTLCRGFLHILSLVGVPAPIVPGDGTWRCVKR